MNLQRNPLFSDLQNDALFTAKQKIDPSSTETDAGAQLLVKYFQLFPNPSAGLIHLQAHLVESTPTLTIQLFNPKGNLLYARNHRPTNGTQVRTQLNLSHLQTGTYTLVLETDTGVRTNQIVIQ